MGVMLTIFVSALIGTLEKFNLVPTPSNFGLVLLKYIIYGLLIAGVSRL